MAHNRGRLQLTYRDRAAWPRRYFRLCAYDLPRKPNSLLPHAVVCLDVKPGATMQTMPPNIPYFHRSRIWRTLALFGALGPPIGGLIFYFGILLMAVTFVGRQSLGTFSEHLTLLPILWVLSYPAGFIPAVLTGTIMEALRFRIPTLVGYLLASVTGGLTSIASAVIFKSPLPWGEVLKEIVISGIPGAVSAIVLYGLMLRNSPLIRSQSS